MKQLLKIVFALFSTIISSANTTQVETTGDLFNAFLNGEIPAYYAEGEVNVLCDKSFYFEDLEKALELCEVGDRVDLDNDGEEELIIKDMLGGMYLDIRDEKVYVLTENYGWCGVFWYTNFDGKTYIVHSDTTHGDREDYWFSLYDGSGKMVDSFHLSKEYYDETEVRYLYCDEEISQSEYEELYEKMIGVI